MPIDYSRLGKKPDMQERRFNVLTYWVKGATPADTAKALEMDISDVYNDYKFITKAKLHDISPEIARGFNLSFYEIKIRELEGNLKDFKVDSKAWLGLQETIRKYKVDSLKLQGLMNEKVEHSGEVTNILEVRYEDRPEDND